MLPMKFAVLLEKSINKNLEKVRLDVSAELQPIVTLIQQTQSLIFDLLQETSDVNIDYAKLPEVNLTVLIAADDLWQKAVSSYTDAPPINTDDLIQMWTIYASIEKSAQYYQQASLNSPHPATRLFLSSLSEIKNILRRRVSGVLRMIYNDVWSEVGFAPFVLGKE
ncbi:MAG TPA: hypothetical protein PKA28_01540 [Methylomusa anaerophila]|uniref:Uncharacterized protein n=1 Tax=Methylomusa anaerophila TaxID=1930071 RepID=A0A348APQ4_9FIRM|nr:hypothetical protein [Methylomusa anaerophila]BBB93052.1 hypothetical protein MAMMFC1_03761 [Methylomusa anaerophila]HML87114.1 hypothetical protein [Methylomusa anaerophila]